MRLKQVLFGGLLLTVGFTACTNDELVDLNSPVSVEEQLKNAVSLGEGYTIVGSKEAETRFVINSDLSSAVWEKTDTVGGAWIGYDLGNDVANPFANIMSNHPFAFSKDLGGMKSVEFKAPTNVFAGKHILYYPFNYKIKGVVASIPVEFEQNPVMDCTAGKEMDHVNRNSFAWTTIDAQGGPEAGNFQLKQVSDIWVIKIGTDAANADRIANQAIEKIILESTNKLYNTATLTKNNKTKYSEFGGQYNNGAPVSTYILTPENASADYQVTAAGDAGLTKKAFYLSTLPADENITSFTVRVILANGRIYSKTFAKSENEALFEKIIAPGKKVELDVLLDTEDTTGAIYTAEQLNRALSAADPGTIPLGADIELDNFTFNKAGKTANITGGKLIVKGDATITAGAVSVQAMKVGGKLTVDDTFTATTSLEADDIKVGESGFFTSNNTGAADELGTVYVDGSATIKAKKVANITVAKAAVLNLTTAEVTTSLKVLRSATANLSGVTLSGSTTNTDGTIGFAGASVNKGTLSSTSTSAASTITGSFENLGTVNLNGTCYNNNTGITNHGTVNVKGSNAAYAISKVVNAAAAAAVPGVSPAKAAGKMVVELTANDKTLTLDATFATGTSIEIKKGKVLTSAANGLDMGQKTKMTVSKGAKFIPFGASENNLKGEIEIAELANLDLATNGVTLATIAGDVNTVITTDDELDKKTNTEDMSGVVKTWVLNGNGLKVTTGNVAKLQAKNLLVKNSLDIQTDITMDGAFNVDGTVTLKSSTASPSVTITLGDKASCTNYWKGALKIEDTVKIEPNSGGSKVVNTASIEGNSNITTIGMEFGI